MDLWRDEERWLYVNVNSIGRTALSEAKCFSSADNGKKANADQRSASVAAAGIAAKGMDRRSELPGNTQAGERPEIQIGCIVFEIGPLQLGVVLQLITLRRTGDGISAGNGQQRVG